jgi:hypothetical protein
MESISELFGPAQGDAAPAIDLVGGYPEAFFDGPAQPVDGKEAVVATHQHSINIYGLLVDP